MKKAVSSEEKEEIVLKKEKSENLKEQPFCLWQMALRFIWQEKWTAAGTCLQEQDINLSSVRH